MLSLKELQIVKFGKANGKTKEQVIKAIQRSRGIKPFTPTLLTQPHLPEQKVGFKEGLTTSLLERRERSIAQTTRLEAGEQGTLETAFQKGTGLVGAGFDVIVEGVKAIPFSEKVGEVVKDRLKSVFPSFAESPIGKLLGLAGKKFEELSPRQQDNTRGALELLALAPIGKVAEVGVKAAAPAVETVARVGAEVVETRLLSQITRDAVTVTKPTLKTKEITAGLEAGRGDVTRITREATLQPSAIDIKVAKSVEDVVKPSNNFVQNIEAVRGKIESASKEIGAKLKGNNTIFNRSQVRVALNETKEESRVIFGTDKVLERNYDAVIDEFMRILDKHPKNLEGMWAARIEFDGVMKKKFPNVFEKFGGDTVRSNAIQDVRSSANDFIANKLPEGSAFREELFNISDMYTARKNIARSAADLIDVRLVDKVMKVIRANPITSFATGGIVTIGALTGLIASPLVLGALLTVGVVKIGQKVFTARVLKEALSKGLRTLEKTLKPDEKAALQKLVDDLDKAPQGQIGLSIQDVSKRQLITEKREIVQRANEAFLDGKGTRRDISRAEKDLDFAVNEGKKKVNNIPTELEPLAKEARKFNTAEEFVGSQTTLFHGTDKAIKTFDLTKTADESIWFTSKKSAIEEGSVAASGTGVIEERFLKPNIKLAGRELDDKFSSGELINQGFRGTKFVDDGEVTTRLFFPNEDTLTKSQLTDIFNKAKGKKSKK